jgi:hypothetical protein
VLLRDAGLTAERVEAKSISFKLLYLTAHLLSYKPTADWLRLRNVSVEPRMRGGERRGILRALVQFKGASVFPAFQLDCLYRG